MDRRIECTALMQPRGGKGRRKCSNRAIRVDRIILSNYGLPAPGLVCSKHGAARLHDLTALPELSELPNELLLEYRRKLATRINEITDRLSRDRREQWMLTDELNRARATFDNRFVEDRLPGDGAPMTFTEALRDPADFVAGMTVEVGESPAPPAVIEAMKRAGFRAGE